MPWESPFFITEADLGIAYRKAKADLYYERTFPYLRDIYDYEKKLTENLASLYERLHCGDLKWMRESAFLGSWSLIPKGIKPRKATADPGNHCLRSDPEEHWRFLVEQYKQTERKQPEAEFRLVGQHSIDFHVVSALWILKVGHKYDEILGEDAYGSRLRRHHKENGLGPINELSLGSFKHYLSYYRQWREKGLEAMSRCIEDNKRVVAITSDLRQFYHSLSPRFLLAPDYLSTVGLENAFSTDQELFTEGLVRAFRSWARKTPLHKDKPHVGLPVGLSASRLIANVALAELDRSIIREVQPLYYGRYVDDVILVLEDTVGFQSAEEVWDFLAKRMNGMLRVAKEEGELSVSFIRDYLGESELKFMGKKQKTFLLKGDSGKVLVDSIRRQINDQASEWRQLPEMEDRSDLIATSLLAACGDDGKAVDGLRKADDISISRAGFAICLRDFEAFEQDLEPDAWKHQRKAFFDTVCRHFLALPKLFDYAPYIPRLVGLAMACRDYETVENLLSCLNNNLELLEKNCVISIAGADTNDISPPPLEKWRQHLNIALYEAMVAALSPRHLRDTEKIEEILKGLPPSPRRLVRRGGVALRRARDWFFLDLARRPLRMRHMPFAQEDEHWGAPVMATPRENRQLNPFLASLPEEEVRSFYEILEKGKDSGPLPLSMLFPTRPFGVAELFMLAPGKVTDQDAIQDWTKAFRGFRSRGELPSCPEPKMKSKNGKLLCVSWPPTGEKIRFALGSLETKIESWKAATKEDKEPDATRYRRINRLVNSVIKSAPKPHYLLLPELSVPPRWFGRLAIKLAHRGISLIAGVDYIHHGKRRRWVANQVWASLLTDFVGFPLPIILRQDKAIPAQQEELDIYQVAGVRLRPIVTAPQKPIIRHGDFHFGILICSELTNIEYRSSMRGKVDALLVPAWNKDIESFSALVEASALDIHAFIAQCNNRMHGDSRIRVPHRDNWLRDVVRVKGGIQDYIVIGEMDVAALRQFQADFRSSADGLFKPVPDGFEIHPSRKSSPGGCEID